MLKQFTEWLVSLIVNAFKAAVDVIRDSFVWLVDQILGAVAAVVNAIPVPSELAGGLQSVWANLDPGILYALSELGLPAALVMIGAAHVVRLVRIFVTLFQWS
jgi:hypothetical protein